jgi:ABC-2 type transport system permease protein
MNTQSNAVSFQSQVIAPVSISSAQSLIWTIRREVWEYRSLYIAPLAASPLIVIGHLIGTIHLPGRLRAAAALDPMKQRQLIEQHYNFAALLLMGITLIVAIFYCLDALYGERRDRSILFWKSLPVSDLTAVLAKASIPVFLLPLLTFVITIATWWIMLLGSSAVFLLSGMSAAPLWTQIPWFHESWMLLYHLVALHGLGYAPVYGWLLLVSAWARRAPFVWALFPPLAIGVVEKIAFNTTYFANMLGSLVSGGDAVPYPPSTGMDAMTHPSSPVSFLLMPSLWIGLAIFAAFLAAAVRLRRSQGPI